MVDVEGCRESTGHVDRYVRRLIRGTVMAKLWIIRSLRAEAYEEIAFREGLVAVGWDAVGDLAAVADQAHIRARVKAAYPFVETSSADAYARQLFQFRSVVGPDDLVLLLRRSRPDVAVGWITGDYRYRLDLRDEVRHVRPVRWLRLDVPRSVVERELPSLPPLNMVFETGANGAVMKRILALADDRSPDERGPAAGQPVTPFGSLQRNLNYARSLATAGQHLAQLQVGSFEVPDVFRAAWVQGVAALDQWVRQEVRSRMLTLAARPTGLPRPKGYATFQIPLEDIERVLQRRATLAEVVDERLGQSRGHLAYQHPDKIKEAFSLVSNVGNIWAAVATVLSERAGEGSVSTGPEVREQLIRIVRRRNKIAHEYDEDPDNPPNKRPIDSAVVTQTIDWIEQLAAAVLIVLDASA
ncbi:hypothetical protein ACFFWC_07730 [Plantactinospora siamensis]|uniref:RiboL-PSP-HEPN domain-containing protein n=1 Tax=Plantactinospora siamensis TaxID=555372 RepID=A0ABV6NYI9_9ACTN